jgi:hypothetical protein
MKRRPEVKILIFCAILFSTHCSSRAVQVDPIDTLLKSPVNMTHVMRLIGRWGLGHGCPVDGVVLTAAHLIQPFYRPPVPNDTMAGYAWSDMVGRKGYLEPAAVSFTRDIGKLRVVTGQPHFYKHAKKEPYVGDLATRHRL